MNTVSPAMKADLLSASPATYLELEYTTVSNGSYVPPQIPQQSQTKDGVTVSIVSGRVVTVEGTCTANTLFLFDLGASYDEITMFTATESDNVYGNVGIGPASSTDMDSWISFASPKADEDMMLIYDKPASGYEYDKLAVFVRMGEYVFDQCAVSFIEGAFHSVREASSSYNQTVSVPRNAIKEFEYSVGTASGCMSVGECVSAKIKLTLLTSVIDAMRSQQARSDVYYCCSIEPFMRLGAEKETMGKFYIDWSSVVYGEVYSTVSAYDFIGTEYASKDVIVGQTGMYARASRSLEHYAVLGIDKSIIRAWEYIGAAYGFGILVGNIRNIFSNDAMLIQLQSDKKYSIRSLIGILAANMCAVCFLDEENMLVFSNESDTHDSISLGPSNYLQGGFDRYAVSSITVKYIESEVHEDDSHSTVKKFLPSDLSSIGARYYIEPDMFRGNETAFSGVYARCVGTGLIGAVSKSYDLTVFGLPFLQFRDGITLTDTAGTAHNLVCWDLTHSYNGAWVTTASNGKLESLSSSDTGLSRSTDTKDYTGINNDYITDCSDGSLDPDHGWRWETWNSGKARCWRDYDLAVDNWVGWGSIYECDPSNVVSPMTLPDNLFAEPPAIIAMFSHSDTPNGPALMGFEYEGGCTATHSCQIRPLRATPAPSATFTFLIECVGRWKS